MIDFTPDHIDPGFALDCVGVGSVFFWGSELDFALDSFCAFVVASASEIVLG